MEKNRRRSLAPESGRPRVRPCANHEDRSYAMTIKDVRTASNQLWKESSNQDPGCISSPLKRERIEQSFRKELARATGQSLGRISKFLAQAEYLTDECLKKLDQSGADEDFFDAAQPAKRLLVKDLMSRGLTQKEIEKEISSAVEQMFQEYERGKKIDRKHWMERLNRTPKENPAWAPGGRVFGKPQTLIYRRPDYHSPVPKPLTAKDVGNRLRELAQEITQLAERPHGNDQSLSQDIGRLLVEMANLRQSVRDQRESTGERVEHGTLH